MYAAQADADPIVLACLDSGSVNAVTLAFHCADQGSELSPDIHARLEDLINSASAPGADPERRRLIAGVLLARHLRQRVRTSGGVYVCSRPITMTLYRAFLDDSQYPGPDSPMPEKLDDKTASGMRASDAAAFVGWVNGIVGGGTVYRLPSRAEIDDMVGRQRFASAGPISASHPSVWLSPVPDLWVPSGTPHPHLLAGGTLAIHVVEDFSRWVPTLTRLQLLRALIAVRGLVRDLDHARRLFLNRSEASPLVRDQALHDIGGACARIRTRADALISTLSRPNALDLGRCSRLAAAIQDSVPAVFRNDDLNDRLDRNKDRADSLARARSRALDLASIIDHALQQDLSRAGTLDHTLGLDTDQGTGKALSHALSEALDTIAITREWPTAFSDAFIKSCDISRNSYMASPDTLTDKVNTLAETLGVMTRTVPSGQTTPSAWMVEVSRRLQRTAIPVFGRQVPLTPAAATSIRLAALCLAAEAEGFADNSVGETFREIAAGVTLLERRASGKAPPTETILLATS